MAYDFPDASPAKFVPLNKTIVVIEDPTLYAKAKAVHVKDENGAPMYRDGEPVLIHTIEKYDGAERIPDVRRAKIVKVADRLKTEGVRWGVHVETDPKFEEEVAVIKGVRKRFTKRIPQYDIRRRTDTVPPVGTVVWYASKNVGRQHYIEDGIEYTLIGAHQIDFIETEGDGLEFREIDPLGAPVA